MTRQHGTISVSLAVLLGPLPLAALALAQDWYVDVNAPGCATGTGTQADPFCDIMDAVAAAADGDTIHIAPGTYLENVVLDKDLDLVGTDGAQVTIVDGMGSGSVVRVGAASVALSGLTLTNGTGTSVNGYTLSGTFGGGLFAYDANSPSQVTLTSCIVTGNSATNPGGQAGGGGLFLLDGVLTISNSTVSSNDAAGFETAGGGISGGGTVTLTGCTVSGNACQGSGGSYSSAGGGGIAAPDLTLTSSTVSDNTCTSEGPTGGGGVLSSYVAMTTTSVSGNECSSTGLDSSADGGGIHARNLTLISSTVSGNECLSTGTSSKGGGIVATYYAVLHASAVSDNVCRALGGTAHGGGIVSQTIDLRSSTVCSNDAEGEHAIGGGICGVPAGGSGCPGSTSVVAINSIVCNNSASGSTFGSGGGIDNRGYSTITNTAVCLNAIVGLTALGGGLHLSGPGDLALENSIVWGNGVSSLTITPGGFPCGGAVSTVVEHSLIEGGWSGIGNLDADPLFVDPLNGDFRLLPGSPCIDAGDSLAVPASIWADHDGKRRFIDDPLTLDTGRTGRLLPVVDMGPHEFGIDPPKKVRQR